MLSLNSHSFYSLLKGTISLEKMVDFAKKTGNLYVSVTDDNGMYGVVQLAKLAAAAGLKPVIGSTINDPEDENEELTILARNNSGYSKLCKIITTRKLKDNFRIHDLLKSTDEDLFILTHSLGLLETAQENSIDNIYAELIITEKQKKSTREIYNYCIEKNIKMCASHPSYFFDEEDFLIHRVVTAIGKNDTLENLDESDLLDKEYYLKSPSELLKMFDKLPDAIRNTEYIAAQCNVDFRFGEYKFPKFELPAGETSYSYLWKICFKGLEDLYKPITDKIVKRLQYELEVIDELGFCDYFLIVWDIVREAQRRNIISIGRGSAANSLVSYCLGLTQVDPIEQNLYFERFLNKGRTSPPDVDLDFSWKERDEIVKYVYEKYGYDKVAMISTHVTFRARSAFRETAKSFGLSDAEISRYSKYIPWTSAKNLPVLAEKFPESRSLKFDEEPWKTIISTASRLSSFPRHLSIHPGGIVITPNPITDYLALEFAKNKGLGLIITQPDMYSIEDMGLIKIDLLSQRSLGVLRDTMNTIKGDNILNKEMKIFKIGDGDSQ
ncbi:MAG: DNA polymerase III subunit alpha [Melioribacteraceae bacterium]|nr:DNA polymerase III subunit alpha [Melioribacteraceae bacterium]